MTPAQTVEADAPTVELDPVLPDSSARTPERAIDRLKVTVMRRISEWRHALGYTVRTLTLSERERKRQLRLTMDDAEVVRALKRSTERRAQRKASNAGGVQGRAER